MRHDHRFTFGLCAALLAAVLPLSGRPALGQSRPRVTTVVAADSCIFRQVGGKRVELCHGGFSGDGGPAAHAELMMPWGLTVDDSGNLFIADTGNNRVRRVDNATGIITTVAGSSVCHSGACSHGFSGDGGPATKAELNSPRGVAVDAEGNLFIGDASNFRVRRVDHATGIIKTVAGNGKRGSGGDGGIATKAEMCGPSAVAVDPFANLFIADSPSNAGQDCVSSIRRVDVATGIITTVAGGGTCCFSPFEKDGPATNARLECCIGAITLDAFGNLFISASIQNARVRRVDHATGIISTVTGGSCPPHGGHCGAGFDGDGGPAQDAHLSNPWGLATDTSGNLFIVDMGNRRIRRVDHATGIITTVAGTEGVEQRFPNALALDAKGNLFISDSNKHHVQKIEGALASSAPGTGQ
jgi:hypothetical protein